MNTLHLGRCLGDVTTVAFQRHYLSHQLRTLEHRENITFDHSRNRPPNEEPSSEKKPVAHQAGTTCLGADNVTGRYLFSGGADATIRVWDLETRPDSHAANLPYTYHPLASLSRANPESHSHALTSISIYPFDPTPSTLLTTSHDRTLILHSITSSELVPIHRFNLDFTPYSHAISPATSATPLIAVGTAHPAVRLLDLRSGLSTHSLPGHNGAVYSVTWHPSKSHILFSGSADGRILTFDIRRANSAFASFDLDDAVGVIGDPPSTGSYARTPHLNFNAVAHNGPVTGVVIDHTSTKLISSGHDQRIRVWDLHSGRNDLVHFGPRVRNERLTEFKPLLGPAHTSQPGHELLFWANDDSRGEVLIHSLREGNMLKVLRTKGVGRSAHLPTPTSRSGSARANQVTSTGRINAMSWRVNADTGAALELYTAHGDGGICAWMAKSEFEEEDVRETEAMLEQKLDEQENKKKRKRDLIGDLVEGLTKKPVTFS